MRVWLVATMVVFLASPFVWSLRAEPSPSVPDDSAFQQQRKPTLEGRCRKLCRKLGEVVGTPKTQTQFNRCNWACKYDFTEEVRACLFAGKTRQELLDCAPDSTGSKPGAEKPQQATSADIAAADIGDCSTWPVRVTLLTAKVWPLKSSGACWDVCVPDEAVRAAKELSKLSPEPTVREVGSAVAVVTKRVSDATAAPDSVATLDFGKSRIVTGDTVRDTFEPIWNASEVFRLSEKETLTISVFDEDADAQADPVGSKSLEVPVEFLREGGVLRTGRFQSVVELEIRFEPVQVSSEFQAGTYVVEIVEGKVSKHKHNGYLWDVPGGPDVQAILSVGDTTIETGTKRDTDTPTWNHKQKIILTGRERLSLKVLDIDVSEHDLIGKCDLGRLADLKLLDGVLTVEDCGLVEKLSVRFQRVE